MFLFIVLFLLLISSSLFLYTKWNRRSLKGMTVMITGAAQGLGKELAISFLSSGCNLILVDIKEEQLRKTVEELNKKSVGLRIQSIVCDVADYAQVEKMCISSVPDVLVNNAGIASMKRVVNEEMTEENMLQTTKVNMLAHFHLIKHLLPAMKTRNSGHIVTIASVMGQLSACGLSDYCASKAAAIQFHECLRLEIKSAKNVNIDTTLILPYGFAQYGLFPGMDGLIMKFVPLLQIPAVAKRIVEAVMNRETEVYIPGYLRWCLPLFRLLPACVRDQMLLVSGAATSIDTVYKNK